MGLVGGSSCVSVGALRQECSCYVLRLVISTGRGNSRGVNFTAIGSQNPCIECVIECALCRLLCGCELIM